MAQDDSKYTKPGLRERIKKRITAGSKGGKPGQWSARKAQMVAAAYKKAGGGYKGGKGKKQNSFIVMCTIIIKTYAFCTKFVKIN